MRWNGHFALVFVEGSGAVGSRRELWTACFVDGHCGIWGGILSSGGSLVGKGIHVN